MAHEALEECDRSYEAWRCRAFILSNTATRSCCKPFTRAGKGKTLPHLPAGLTKPVSFQTSVTNFQHTSVGSND
uniref:Uncharacterized protein n=1 Tax=Anguilla anguilla TaxID=7936 RepID=A0A0E9X3D5_ANGAN